MKHLATASFWERYNRLPESVRRQADRNFALLKRDPKHPSLHFKRVGRFWSVRIGLKYRALAVEIENGLLWFWIGTHDEYEQTIQQA
jgi:hypothetical protein